MRRLAISAVDLLYAALSAVMLALGFYMELRRERTESRRTDPHTAERLARIEEQAPVREAMERMARLEEKADAINDKLDAWERLIGDVDEEPEPAPRPRRAKGARKSK
jgi:hypothetical protein